jgi:hypothetical protein
VPSEPSNWRRGGLRLPAFPERRLGPDDLGDEPPQIGEAGGLVQVRERELGQSQTTQQKARRS